VYKNKIDLQGEIEMQTNLQGRLRKLRQVENYKMPLLEAVANSVQAIPVDQIQNQKGKVEVSIIWDDDANMQLESIGKKATYRQIKDIVIKDNGVGFDDKNLKSFQTLDTTFKEKDFGCLGVGRLLWLKAFDHVEIKSCYLQDGKQMRRRINFSVKGEVEELPPSDVPVSSDEEQSTWTEVRLVGLKNECRNKRGVSVHDVAEVILKHFVLLFSLGSMPNVSVGDGENKRVVNDLFRSVAFDTPRKDEFTEGNRQFVFYQQKLRMPATKATPSAVYLCAGGRVVSKLTKDVDPKIGPELTDGSGQPFLYVGLLRSDFLDENVSSSRDVIIFPETSSSEDSGELSFGGPTESALGKKVSEFAAAFLAPEFKVMTESSNDRLQTFADNYAPEFKGFLNEHRQELFVSQSAKDEDLYFEVHKKFYEYEREQNKRIEKLVACDWAEENPEEMIDRITADIEPIHAHDLAKFAAHRKFYLDMLKKAMQLRDDGNYQREKAVHSLVFPMRQDSLTSDGMSRHNLWLLDDRLAFSHYLASDKSLKSMPITDSQSIDRPDIMALRLYGQGDSERPGELSIIEFKRPGRNDYNEESNPVSQVLDYVDELRAGRVSATDGTEISNAGRMPIFCYVIAQFTDKLKKQCRHSGLKENANGDYYFGTVDGVYFEVTSINSLYRKAYEHNQALLRAAGLIQ